MEELVTLDCLFIDGTKIEANANKYSFVWKKTTEKFSAKLQEQIQVYFQEEITPLNTEWMNVFLEELSQAYPYDYFLLVMDNAIWHKSSILKIPTNIGFAFIPPYTPEMNPIEQVWKEIRKRGFKNKAFRTLEDVMNQLQDVIQGLEKEVIKSIVNRRWTRMLFESR
ncbi:transposase family protein [Streptococcus pneumoniae]|nr:transposase family protein [Streptococcus pneumoniae]